MNKSESIVNISAALVKAQRNIGAAAKGTKNPFFNSKFANLNSVMEACKEALNENGITVLQPVLSADNGDFVETILLHESGEFFSSAMRLKVSKEDMQQFGSAVSYARRYGLQSMVFIPAEDDDAEATMNRPKAKILSVDSLQPLNKTQSLAGEYGPSPSQKTLGQNQSSLLSKQPDKQIDSATSTPIVVESSNTSSVAPAIPQKSKAPFKKPNKTAPPVTSYGNGLE